jgi:hypothetical protein
LKFAIASVSQTKGDRFLDAIIKDQYWAIVNNGLGQATNKRVCFGERLDTEGSF